MKRDADPEFISPASPLAPKAIRCNDSQRQKTTPTGWAVALGATLKKDQRLSATDIGGGDRGAGWGISPRRRRLAPKKKKKKKSHRPGVLLPSFPQPTDSSSLAKGVGIWGLFRNRVQPHSGKALSSQLEPHVQGELGVAKEQPRFNPPRLRDPPAFKNRRTQQKNGTLKL